MKNWEKEPERSWKALRGVEEALKGHGQAITYPLADAVLDVLVERDELRREVQAMRRFMSLRVAEPDAGTELDVWAANREAILATL